MAKIIQQDFNNLDSYTSASDDWMIVKVHGSVGWGYPWVTADEADQPKKAARKFPPPELDQSKLAVGLPLDLLHQNKVYYPAIALPVGRYGFVCPNEHVSDLQDFLKSCDGLLSIGFSAYDDDLLKFLRRYLSSVLKADLVTGKKDRDDVAERLKTALPLLRAAEAKGDLRVSGGGFTDYLERDFDTFVDGLIEAAK